MNAKIQLTSAPHDYATVNTAPYSADVFTSGYVQVYLPDGRAYELNLTGLIECYSGSGSPDWSSHVGRIS